MEPYLLEATTFKVSLDIEKHYMGFDCMKIIVLLKRVVDSAVCETNLTLFGINSVKTVSHSNDLRV